jgi:hypothetical protein
VNRDLTSILNEWPYEPGHLIVRLIEGEDERPRLQVRLDLGILQMLVDGRPDGLSPYGYDSLLEYFEACLDDERHDADMDDSESDDPGDADADGYEPSLGLTDDDDDDADSPDSDSSSDDSEEPIPDGLGDPPPRRRAGRLTAVECRALRDEAAQYYHRYVALMAIEDFEGVVRDTTRNLRVLDLCRDHAVRAPDRAVLEQFRPYITMMRARALASLALKRGEQKAAVFAINEGLEALRRFFESVGHPELYESSGEAQMLRAMRDALVPKLPLSQISELEQRLKIAISNENYELAAILRDELRMMGSTPASPPGSSPGPTSGPGPGQNLGPGSSSV